MGVALEGDESENGILNSDTYYGDYFDQIHFDDHHVLTYQKIDPRTGDSSTEEHRYRLEQRAKVSFLRLDEEANTKWLMLRGGDLIFLYDGETEPPFIRAARSAPNAMEAFYHFPDAFSASSYLTEGDITYGPDNLGSHSTREPWVEGVPGQGIGEEIHIDRWFGRLWISIGFVSYDRPELYEMNSRPKTIRVVSEATGEERVVELEDTPNPQPIEVPGEWETASEGGIRIIIEEVYPGTRWEDTVVNFIVFF
ncbi:MAG: NADase-type glycan-binding domain-containing protein [Spirochaetaceae bacterium]